MANQFRIFLWLALLGAGFLAGAAWTNRAMPSPTAEPSIPEQPAPQPVSQPGSSREPEAGAGLTPQERSNIRLFEEAAPSVCYITTTNVRRDYFSRNITEIPRGSGSGFVWDAKGHIITNYHVIQGADRATVTLADRSTWQAVPVGVAPEKDLAVLKIEAPASVLQPIPVGTSDDLRVGQSVYAIGNPFGLDQTLTTGIVSALGREIESVAGIPIRDAIQTDAAINPGNSGGPLLDSSGRLIGVNTAIYSPSGASAGIGFSIPVDVVRWVVPELIDYGEIKRPSLGVELARPQIVERLGLKGALVIDVIENGAAERAGIRPTLRDRSGSIILGDIITQLGGEAIESNSDLILALEKFQPGEEVEVRVLRDDQELTAKIRLDQPR
ncbi:S1C family serine protease [Phaeodactylibacter luteus]|uniref:Trypsin-like serine protease n=1 Tax=Phaeodactylibacter luteus TaxID=1564516 RepID=A0A5C6RL57_9BACT|nr:trypsin-like peptidase domain-containing protein [Phaeodactylibacter luteus]TXB62649.1 trypsin-like serine protease [Phaeodactylibacter luteus]